MSCDVGQWLLKGDEIVPQVEDLVHQSKELLLLPNPGSYGPGFRPRNHLKVDVIVTATGQKLSLKAFESSRGTDIELSYRRRVLRHMHVHERHHNPGGKIVDGPHMHFPSKRFSLRIGYSSYAYLVDELVVDSDLNEALNLFCSILDITISTPNLV